MHMTDRPTPHHTTPHTTVTTAKECALLPELVPLLYVTSPHLDRSSQFACPSSPRHPLALDLTYKPPHIPLPSPSNRPNSFMVDDEDRRFYLKTLFGTQFDPSLCPIYPRPLRVSP